MSRVIAIAMLAVLLGPLRATAQDATPLPVPGPKPAVTASRLWDAPASFSYDYLDTVVWLYTADEDAKSVFQQYPAYLTSLEVHHDKREIQVDVVSAPIVGDESVVLKAVVTSERRPYLLQVYLISRVRRWIYFFTTTSFLEKRAQPALDQIVHDLLATAQHVTTRQPSATTPTTSGGITTGGAFDLLPSSSEVPPGMTLEREQVAVEGTPVIELP
jgi:hypothetical protein